MNNFKLIIETDNIDDIKSAASFEGWPATMFQILADLRQAHKHGLFGWLEGFKDSGITQEDGAEMCYMLTKYIAGVMDEYGTQI